MKPLTAEWVQKAEDDYIVAQKMFRARKHPVYDAVCFHAQQCAEKYLKAFLQENERDVPKTHKFVLVTESLNNRVLYKDEIKTYLLSTDHSAAKTHKLLDLLKICKEVDSSLEILLPDLREIERFSVNVRYPGMSADKDEAKIAFNAAQVVRSLISGHL